MTTLGVKYINPKQIVKIEVPYGATGTKVLNEHGLSIHPRIVNVSFEHRVGELPKLTLEVIAMETVIEGEMEVEQVVVCPACKKELAESKKRTVETTTHGDEYRRFESL